jgi:hypothetical protein
MGSIETNNDDGEVDIYYTATGPNGVAEMRVAGTKLNGEWTYREMTATVDGQTIDLQAVDLQTENE